MNVFCLTDDDNIFDRWFGLLKNDYGVVTDFELYTLYNSLIIIDGDIIDSEKFISSAVKNNNSVLVLQRVPELEMGVKYLRYGALGYGNSMMSKSFFISAIESVLDGFTWLAPNITSQLILSLSQPLDISKELAIFTKLTPTQKSIAHLLKIGLKNIEIAQKLDISINTVKKHVKDIYERLGVSDRLAFNKLFL